MWHYRTKISHANYSRIRQAQTNFVFKTSICTNSSNRIGCVLSFDMIVIDQTVYKSN